MIAATRHVIVGPFSRDCPLFSFFFFFLQDGGKRKNYKTQDKGLPQSQKHLYRCLWLSTAISFPISRLPPYGGKEVAPWNTLRSHHIQHNPPAFNGGSSGVLLWHSRAHIARTVIQYALLDVVSEKDKGLTLGRFEEE